MTPRALRAWISRNVPEANTPGKTAALASGLELVGHLLRWPNLRMETDSMRVATLNRESAAVVKAWDVLDKTLRAHSTWRTDIRRAMAETQASAQQAGRFTMAMRSVIERYRVPLKPPRRARPARFRGDILAQAVLQLRETLDMSENRAVKILAAFARRHGLAINAPALRQSVRNRRVKP